MISAYARRKSYNYLAIAVAVACAIVAIIPLGAMLIYVLQQGGGGLNLDFFTQLPRAVGEPGGGMAQDIVGTLVLIGLASLVGLPIGIIGGIYLSQTTNVHFARTVRFVTDVIAGTPSIVAGVVAYALIVIPMGNYSA